MITTLQPPTNCADTAPPTPPKILEGPDESVSTRMALIERDARHSEIRHLIEKPIEVKLFAEWSAE